MASDDATWAQRIARRVVREEDESAPRAMLPILAALVAEVRREDAEAVRAMSGFSSHRFREKVAAAIEALAATREEGSEKMGRCNALSTTTGQ